MHFGGTEQFVLFLSRHPFNSSFNMVQERDGEKSGKNMAHVEKMIVCRNQITR